MKRIITAVMLLLAAHAQAQMTIDEYKQRVNDSITNRTYVNSVTPQNVGDRMIELADIVKVVKDTADSNANRIKLETLQKITERGKTTTENLGIGGTGTDPNYSIRFGGADGGVLMDNTITGFPIDEDKISGLKIYPRFIPTANNQLFSSGFFSAFGQPNNNGFTGVRRASLIIGDVTNFPTTIFWPRNTSQGVPASAFFTGGVDAAGVVKPTRSVVHIQGTSAFQTDTVLLVETGNKNTILTIQNKDNGETIKWRNMAFTTNTDTLLGVNANGYMTKILASTFIASKIAGIDTLFPTYNVKVANGGVKGDYKNLSGLSITTGTNTVTSSSSVFSASDTGKTIIVWGAGTGTDGSLGDELVAKITGYISPTQVSIATNATVTVSNAKGGYGTDNTTKFNQLVAGNPKNVAFEFSNNGDYYFKDLVLFDHDTNITIIGNKARFYFISSNPKSYITGTQPQRDLFHFDYCQNVFIKDIIGYNIGQTQARPNHAQEGNYYDTLNNVPVVYNRRYNKHANSGRFIQNNFSVNVNISGCSSYDIGTFYGSSGTYNAFGYGSIKDNYIHGYALTAIFPAPFQNVEGNYIINTPAPVGNYNDFAGNKLTSHAIYHAGGYSGVNVTNNKVIDCRGAAIQWNSTSGKYSESNIASSNIFSNCLYIGYIGGNDTGKVVQFVNNTIKRSGAIIIDNPQITLTASRNTWVGEPDTSVGVMGAYSLSRAKSVYISDDFSQKKNIIGISNEKQLGDIVLDGCNADSSNSIFINGRLPIPEWGGKLTVRNCNLGTTSYIYLTTDSLPPNSARRIQIVNNVFDVWESEGAIAAQGGYQLFNNTFNLYSSSSWALNFGLLQAYSDSLYAIGNTFINNGSTNVLNISSAASSKFNLTQNTFVGFSSTTPYASVSGNTYKAVGNYFSGNNQYDKLRILSLELNAISEYSDNAAAISAGLKPGSIYRTGDVLKAVH